MTDRELLEAAARAAGIDGSITWTTGVTPWLRTESGAAVPWGPLDDDGDALRLAVSLDLEILPRVGMVTVAGNGVWEEVATSNSTREEATRRAIVRAAAALAAQ